MSLWNRRIGRLAFALGFIPVLVLALALAWSAPDHRWRADGDPTRIALVFVLAAWTALVTAWRCHDYGKSAWSNFWTDRIPIVGPLIGLWDLLSKPGDARRNSYGPVPKL